MRHSLNRERLYTTGIAALLSTGLATGLMGCKDSSKSFGESQASAAATPGAAGGLAVSEKEVVVGQLHSATGTMAISETGSIEAERLAIEQINDMGGILGRKMRIIQEDGASDWPTFAEKAKLLL